jgi:osmoprotectant transport system permease protein
MKWVCGVFIAVGLSAGCSGTTAQPRPGVEVGAKNFTESVILADMAVQLARRVNATARRADLGTTSTLWLALTRGEIDVYPEYTGTISRQILNAEPPDLAATLAPYGVRISRPLGFRNNWALAMRRDAAAARGIRTTSDLRGHPDLRFGFTHLFLNRRDGWPGLRAAYGLPQTQVSGLNHALAYKALIEGAIDVTDGYTTDPEIAGPDLIVLADDRRFFPSYESLWLYRADLENRAPDVVRQLRRLEGRVSEAEMQLMNARVQQAKEDEGQVAAHFLNQALAAGVDAELRPISVRVLGATGEHLQLVVPSLFAAALVGIPLGVLAVRRPGLGRTVLGIAAVLQTIPSLALLLFMIPVMHALTGQGTGAVPAVAALFLYSLLPIVRNTCTGLMSIPGSLLESAHALGLSPWEVLWRVEFPLATPVVLTGVRTAAVINVGTATLGGFIGAGGYGQPILRGVEKLDLPLMLEGAVPAALMALAAEALFELAECAVVRRR